MPIETEIRLLILKGKVLAKEQSHFFLSSLFKSFFTALFISFFGMTCFASEVNSPDAVEDSSESTPGDTIAFDSVEISIQIERSVANAFEEKVRRAAVRRLCAIVGNALIVGKGPWGFGYVKEMPNCRVVERVEAEKGEKVWTFQILRESSPKTEVDPPVGKSEVNRNNLVFQICRRIENAKDNVKSCFAEYRLKWTRHTLRFLTRTGSANAIVGALNDQMPLQSIASAALIQTRSDGQRYFRPLQNDESDEIVTLPKFDAQLVAVEVQYSPRLGTFRLKSLSRKEALERTEEGNVWLVSSRVRNRRAAVFKKLIVESQNKFELDIKKRTITSRAPSKLSPNKGKKTQWDGEASIRFGYFNGLEKVGPVSSLGGGLDFAIYRSPWVNFWLDGAYTQSRYRAASEISSGEIVTADEQFFLYQNLRLGVGAGIRYAFLNDIKLLFYPRVSLANLSWKPESILDDDAVGYTPATKLTSSPFIGLGTGINFPERWPVKPHATIGVDFGKQYRGLYSDIEFLLDVPPNFAFRSSFGLFDKAWFSVYTRAQRQYFSVINQYGSTKELDIFEVIVGFGYRLEIL